MSKLDKLIEELCPDGVGYVRLNDVTKVLRGKRLTKKELLDDGKYPVFHGGLEPLGFYNKKNRNRNTVMIINVGASAGTVGYSDRDFWSSDGCFCLEHSVKLNNRFIYHVLSDYEQLLKSKVRFAGIPTLNNKDVEELQVPLPPLLIQEEIVRILDNFTELITELTTELAAELTARRKQYEYYRDLLLTFPAYQQAGGDEVEWKTLGDIGKLIRGSGLLKSDFVDEGFPCIHYGQIHTYYGTSANETISFVSPEQSKKLKKAKKGDVLIVGVSENIEDVCKPLAWFGEDVCISGDMFAFRHNQNTKYITYLLQTTDFSRYKEKFAHGAKVTRLRQDKLLAYNIPIPPLSEQERIVSILDKFDALVNDISIGLPAEIEARQKQYKYYREKLLTFKELDVKEA